MEEDFMIRVAILDLDIVLYHCASSCEKDSDRDNVLRTVDLYIKDWILQAGCNYYIGFLTLGRSNFRNGIANTWPYKGNRISNIKPSWYPEIRQYLIDHWKAEVALGIEADDGLAIAQTYFNSKGIYSVIVTEDKDLLQVPGYHFNIHKDNKVFEITPEQAFKNLWLQVITGDTTDNIPGVSHAISETTLGTYNTWLSCSSHTIEEKRKLYRRPPAQELFGPAGALQYLSLYELKDWPSKVLELYIDKYEDDEDDEGYGTLRFEETFALIYMLRTLEETKQYTNHVLNLTYYNVPIEESVESLFEVYMD